MDEIRLTTGEIVRSTLSLMRANLAGLFPAVFLLSVTSTLVDIYDRDGFTNLPLLIAFMVMQFWLLKHVLAKCGRIERISRSGGTFVGASILGNIGIALGAIALVIPGIVLAVRWSAAVPIALSEEQSAPDALAESWRRTKGGTIALFLAYIVTLPLIVAGTIAYMLAEGDPLLPIWQFFAIANACSNLWMITGWFMSVAVYLAITPAAEPLETIFA